MKLNKTLALATLIAGSLFAGNIVTQAQNSTNMPPATTKSGGKNARGLNITFLAKQLNLTDAEKPKVEAVLAEQQQKQRELHTDKTLSAEDKKAKMKEIREATDTQLKKILTPEQYAKWEKSGTGRRRPIPMTTPGTSATNAPATVK